MGAHLERAPGHTGPGRGLGHGQAFQVDRLHRLALLGRQLGEGPGQLRRELVAARQGGLHGGLGDDKLSGGDGFDVLDGGEGDDTCDGGELRDEATGCENETSIERRPFARIFRDM